MKKALLLTAASSLAAFLFATLLNMVAPHVGSQVVEAQSCCDPPPQPWPGVKWPKNTEVHVKIDSAFDDVEVEAIKAAFKEWDIRGLNTCSNVTYPEPYEVVASPPVSTDNIYYVKYRDDFTAPQPGISGGRSTNGRDLYYVQSNIFRNIRQLALPQFKGAFVKGVMLHEIGHQYGLNHFNGVAVHHARPCATSIQTRHLRQAVTTPSF